ncbi:MAG: sigma-54-dependent Fis family transcriptional regulator [Candidatus Solibacter usitatus]|nr:sigma-54-dependent Fis family transcriptional regulator [Candidatus Solibacter usitatus]
METGKILIVDDEPVVRESLDQWFAGEGYRTKAVADGREALAAVASERWDLALLDIKTPGMDGMELQTRLREADPDLTVIIMTGYATVETAVQALKNGAYDYITKPVDPDELSHLVNRALEHRHARQEVARLRENLREIFPHSELIGTSPPMRRVIELVETVAPTDATVLINGESGTGKEVVARAIHAASPRRHMPMLVIHCGALTETLLESELFGHERAFTGAQYRRKGKFEVGDGGTVFLDEIGDIRLKTQTDLLRVLQEKEIVRVGGSQPVKVDFRCIAASNKSLDALVKMGAFRPDLYYRLHVVCIELPPLRQRREDIPLLADHFLHKLCAATNRPSIPRITAAAMEQLMNYDWPGNVRELENAMERALVIGRCPEIGPDQFTWLQQPAGAIAGRTLDDVERAHIERIWAECRGNHSLAARILGIDRSTLYHKLKRYAVK